MRSIVLAAAALSLLAQPAFARDRDKDGDRDRIEQHVFRIGPEDFGAFEFGAMRGSRLGVQVSTMTDELRAAMGASKDVGILVNRVLDDTPAKKAGLEAGDVIVEVAGEPVSDVGDVWKALAGKDGEVQVEVIREKRHKNFTVKLEQEARPMIFGAGDPELKRQIDELQQQVKELQKRLDKLEKK